MKTPHSFLSLILAAALCTACVEKENKVPVGPDPDPDTENPTPDPGTDGPGTTPDLPGLILEESFSANQGAFTIEDVKKPSALNAVWAFASGYGMKATAYAGNTNYEAESRLISPELDLTDYKTAWLTFDHTVNYANGNDLKNFIGLAVTKNDGESWEALPIPGYPSGSDWNFVNAGNVDLAAHCGSKVKIAFVYKSTAAVAPTWEVKNVLVSRDCADIGDTYAAVPKWLELPAVSNKDDFHIHTALDKGEVRRNYSFSYDGGHYVATWVAYPLCNYYTAKNVSRSDSWYADPFVDDQAILAKSGDFYANGYERGHQIPSADRLCTRQFNDQTFYYTNATPQLAEFNEGVWVTIENRVRDWSAKSDTLYVLTGCVIGDDPKTVEDNVGKKVAIPEAYFKAVLRYDKASTANGGFSAFATWLAHEKKTPSWGKSVAISVDELEKKLGMELFVNLADKIGKEDAAAVKAADPAKDNFWWQ